MTDTSDSTKKVDPNQVLAFCRVPGMWVTITRSTPMEQLFEMYGEESAKHILSKLDFTGNSEIQYF